MVFVYISVLPLMQSNAGSSMAMQDHLKKKNMYIYITSHSCIQVRVCSIKKRILSAVAHYVRRDVKKQYASTTMDMDVMRIS